LEEKQEQIKLTLLLSKQLVFIKMNYKMMIRKIFPYLFILAVFFVPFVSSAKISSVNTNTIDSTKIKAGEATLRGTINQGPEDDGTYEVLYGGIHYTSAQITSCSTGNSSFSKTPIKLSEGSGEGSITSLTESGLPWYGPTATSGISNIDTLIFNKEGSGTFSLNCNITTGNCTGRWSGRIEGVEVDKTSNAGTPVSGSFSTPNRINADGRLIKINSGTFSGSCRYNKQKPDDPYTCNGASDNSLVGTLEIIDHQGGGNGVLTYIKDYIADNLNPGTTYYFCIGAAETAEAALHLAQQLHDRGIRTVIVSGGSSLATYSIFNAAWDALMGI